MQKYVAQPHEPEEAEEVVEDDSQEKLDLEPAEVVEDAPEEAEEEAPDKQANTGEALVLSPSPGGLCTGSTMVISYECSKDQMRSLLEAEAAGLAPFFSFSIQ